eukprot:7370508-Alexandrium_andersonii.AAC.1
MRPGQYALVGLEIEASTSRGGGLMGSGEYVYGAWGPMAEFDPNSRHWGPLRQADPSARAPRCSVAASLPCRPRCSCASRT